MVTAMSTQSTPFLTPEQYLEIENNAEHKSEYVNGEVLAMAGAPIRHVGLVGNIGAAAMGRLRGSGCRTYSSNLRLRVKWANLFTYPDVMIVCAEPVVSDVDPNAIVTR